VTEREKWDVLCEAMQGRYPVLASVWQLAEERFGPAWLPECIRNIERLYGPVGVPMSDDLSEMLDGYAEFANDSMRSQVYYERTGRYKASSYEEVRASCYWNEEHMTRRYLPGMYVSHYIWPQHYHMLRGFIHGILPRVRASRLFFEVGVGCGVYSRAALEHLPHVRGVAFDISAHALRFSGQVVEASGSGDRYRLEQRDIKDGYHEAADFLICQEVLEHLENPGEFCVWLRELVKPGGWTYITAALNAAHSDHIFLFHEPSELEAMLRQAGLQPYHLQEECAAGTKPRRLTPSLAGYLCQRPR